MHKNEIDVALAKLSEDSTVRRCICEELLFFYILWEREKHADKWFNVKFGKNRENVWFLFRVCSLSYVNNRTNNLFQIFDAWGYTEPFPFLQRAELSFMFQPHPINLCRYNCSTARSYEEVLKWGEKALDLSWATLNTVAKIIEHSEALSSYASMIKDTVHMLKKDADYFHTNHPVPQKCLKGYNIGFWDKSDSPLTELSIFER